MPEDIPECENVETNEFEQQENQSNILDISSSKSLRNKNKNNPYIAYLNINSFINKIDDLRNMISDITPKVLTIIETKIDYPFPDAQFLIGGYQNPCNLRKDRNRHGGGLITYIKRGIPYKRLTKLEPMNLEVTCVEITFGKCKWGYVAVYRPPDTNITNFFDDLSKCLEQITNLYDLIIITGDININTIDETSPGLNIYR